MRERKAFREYSLSAMKRELTKRANQIEESEKRVRRIRNPDTEFAYGARWDRDDARPNYESQRGIAYDKYGNEALGKHAYAPFVPIKKRGLHVMYDDGLY